MDETLAYRFLSNCKKRLRRPKIVDTMAGEMAGGELLLRTLILRRLLKRNVLSPDERNVGVLLPPSNGAVTVNMALALDRRVAINLNYTVTSKVLNACIKQAGIRHVLSSQKVLNKLNLELDAEVVSLETLKDKVTLSDKLAGAAGAYLTPAWLLHRQLGLGRVTADDLMTVIFTSGSTGDPKGVMLTEGNIRSNVNAIDNVVRLRPDDVLIGVLPFFHSFGYTVTMWTAMAFDVLGAYHFDPLSPRQVAQLVKKNKGTLLLATPTFLRTYLRRCNPEDLESLDVVVAGAEKLPTPLCDAFEEKFGVRPVEGYGATELSPLVSVNVPPSRATQPGGVKEGTVGRPIPQVKARVVSLETGKTLGPNESGMLQISGPNVMKGYLGRDDLTAEAVRDGWYVTGDVALIDDEGFIHITGRESRFSKIGGEMVPHILVEEKLAELISASETEGLKAVVTSLPDEKKGERLVVVHTPLTQPIEELTKGLAAAGLPNLYIPGADCFVQVDQLPMLGTGKLDLKKVQQIAAEQLQ